VGLQCIFDTESPVHGELKSAILQAGLHHVFVGSVVEVIEADPERVCGGLHGNCGIVKLLLDDLPLPWR
jgi:hypothetical protein